MASQAQWRRYASLWKECEALALEKFANRRQGYLDTTYPIQDWHSLSEDGAEKVIEAVRKALEAIRQS